MSGMQMAMMAAAGGAGTGAGGFGGQVYVARVGATCGSRATFNADGSVAGANNGFGTVSSDTVSGDNYWRPTTSGIGGNGGNAGGPLFLFATVTSGALSSGTTGAWTSLAAGLVYQRNSPGSIGVSTVIVSFQVATDNAGANVIATGSIQLDAEFA